MANGMASFGGEVSAGYITKYMVIIPGLKQELQLL
jgi:hypothetical protein